MNVSAIRRLRARLAEDRPVYGVWITLESVSISEMAVALGLDWIVLDAEHGQLDWQELVAHVRSTVRSETVVLVKVTELNTGLVKRALDIGADGVVIPWIESTSQLLRAVADSRYPPAGHRGVGGERATAWGQCFADHTAEADDHVLVVPMIESVAGGAAIEELCDVAGVELFFLGPADYSASLGRRGEWEGPEAAKDFARIREVIRGRGKNCGVIAMDLDDLVERQLQGFRMLALGTDVGIMFRGLHAALGRVGRDRRVSTDLRPATSFLPSVPLPRPPASLTPDRAPAISAPPSTGDELAPGVHSLPLVGAAVGARGITTAKVVFEPGARLACHRHDDCAEALCVLSGALTVAVEGRTYELAPLDSIVIPAGVPHAAWNSSATDRAAIHVSLASERPSRQMVADEFASLRMPADSCGRAGCEYLVRYDPGRAESKGAGTAFTDHFNRDHVAGITMCGGYGRFEPGGRLPAHLHNYDESICIVEGVATCVVEGRRFQLSDHQTAFQPRGRVHYFVNESDRPMAMIWVYAGPRPEFILVEDHWADQPRK